MGKKPSVFVQSPSTLPTLTAVAEAIASMNVVLRDTATPPAGSAAASATPAQALAALYAAFARSEVQQTLLDLCPHLKSTAVSQTTIF